MTTPPRLALLALALCAAPAARADESADRALVRGLHDATSETVNVALRNETAFGLGPRNRTGNLTVAEPSFLTLVGDTWGLAHHIHFPLVWQPEVVARYGGTYGMGDLGYDLYLAAPPTEALSVGGGFAAVLPTASDRRIGESKWQLGPALSLSTAWGPVSLAVSARQLFTLGSTHTEPDVNRLVVQPTLAWALRGGWFLLTSPRLQADWKASSSERFTVPIGGGGGRLFSIATQRLSLSVEAYTHVAPRDASGRGDWIVRAGVSLLYPR